MTMLELERVGFHRRRQQIVQNVSLSLEAGQSLGLIGPNGCGKTTLLKLIATLLHPAEGRVLVDGFDTRLDVRNVRRRIGYVPDQLGVYPGLSVWQYLMFFARCAGLEPIERKTTLESLLRVVDLYEQRQTQVQQLSRGMLRRLALARALVHNPSLLLLDDPLGGLDGRGRLELLEVLKELREMGITVVMSGHLLGDIVQLCTQVAILREGRLIRTASVEELVQQTPRSSRLELELLIGEEVARARLARQPDVRDIESDGQTISFTFHGDRAALATLVDELVGAGVQIVRLGPGPGRYDELAAGLADTSAKVAV